VSTEPSPGKEKLIQRAVIGILEQHHFQPEDINDDFSSEVFDTFLKFMDGRKRFFTQEDISRLETHRLLIDDQINAASFDFFDEAFSILNLRADESEAIFQESLAEPIDFSQKETIEFDVDKLEWPADQAGKISRWNQRLKYDVLTKVTSLLDKQEKELKAQNDKDKNAVDLEDDAEDLESLIGKSFEEIEKDARTKVLEDYTEWFKRYKKLRRSDRYETYLNVITHMFDPHSDYFNPKKKEDFDINIGGKLEGIGARLQTEGDLTKVVSIVPGGPVWKNKEIEVNDYILKVRQEEDEQALDVFGMRLSDVVSHIRGKKGTFVNLSIQKKDGSTIEVKLERDVINLQESFAKSAIIDLDGGAERIGYIDLPKFYSTFNRDGEGNSCAVDVAHEIEKLKANHVNGIILDLRSNGGGSLRDVVDMSGLFIEEGPIVQVKSRKRKAYVYDDEDKEVQYDGPLIVMINSFSASASEILAAAMQDYGRAIIVGSQSYGKGTVQRFIDLDKAVSDKNEYKPLGELKLTMQKFYRVNGGSTQLKGVTPDIVLPDRYRLIEVGEREYPSAMEWSELKPIEVEQDVFNLPDLNLLAQNSNPENIRLLRLSL